MRTIRTQPKPPKIHYRKVGARNLEISTQNLQNRIDVAKEYLEFDPRHTLRVVFTIIFKGFATDIIRGTLLSIRQYSFGRIEWKNGTIPKYEFYGNFQSICLCHCLNSDINLNIQRIENAKPRISARSSFTLDCKGLIEGTSTLRIEKHKRLINAEEPALW